MKLQIQRQFGFSLLEVLITLVILSIGLLGVAGMQLSSLKNSQSAYLRSQSTYLAYDIVDRMRANQEAFLNGEYDTDMTDSIPSTPSTIAKIDIQEWLTALQDTLPAGDGSIVTNGDSVTVTTQWDDSRVGNNNQQFVLDTKI